MVVVGVMSRRNVWTGLPAAGRRSCGLLGIACVRELRARERGFCTTHNPELLAGVGVSKEISP